jgi:aspartokinase/homoserine dehydrogenase 1
LENGKVEINLEMVDENHPFFTLSGSDNIISFTTERYKERPLVVKGPGAGAEVTAAGVFAELVNVGA